MGILLVSGTYPSNFIRFSIAGIPQSDQLTVRLDGRDIRWAVEEGVGKDRYFYEYLCVEEGGFSDGEHEIQFLLNYDDPDEITEGSGPQLCSIEVLEYGAPHEYVFSESRPFLDLAEILQVRRFTWLLWCIPYVSELTQNLIHHSSPTDSRLPTELPIGQRTKTVSCEM